MSEAAQADRAAVPRILVFAGSARRESLNKKLARAAARLAEGPGAEVRFIDLDDFPMPLYHGDLEDEQGMPAKALELREIFIAHDALLIASPENNHSVTALLKNTLDWLSRDIGDGKGQASGLAPFRGKVAGIMGATPGPWGTLRGGIPHLRTILAALGVLVLGPQVPVARADEVFDAEGNIKDSRVERSVKSLVGQLIETTRKQHG